MLSPPLPNVANEHVTIDGCLELARELLEYVLDLEVERAPTYGTPTGDVVQLAARTLAKAQRHHNQRHECRSRMVELGELEARLLGALSRVPLRPQTPGDASP